MNENEILNDILEATENLTPAGVKALVESLVKDTTQLTVAIVRCLQALEAIREGLEPLGEVSNEFPELSNKVDEVMEKVIQSCPEVSRQVIRESLAEGVE